MSWPDQFLVAVEKSVFTRGHADEGPVEDESAAEFFGQYIESLSLEKVVEKYLHLLIH